MTTTQVYHVFIRATAEQIWAAITRPDLTPRYFHGVTIEITPSGRSHIGPRGEAWDADAVLEFDAPRRLVHEWRSQYDEELAAEPVSRVTWEIVPAGRRHLPRDAHPRPPGGLAEDGRGRLGHRVDVRAELDEVPARDGRSAAARELSRRGRGICARGRAGRAGSAPPRAGDLRRRAGHRPPPDGGIMVG